MKNDNYSYPNFELWGGKPWENHVSFIDGLAQWLGENTPLHCGDYPHRAVEKPKEDPDYRPKTESLDDHMVMEYWASKGIRMTVLSQGGKRWIAMVPEMAIAKRSEEKISALVVFHKENYADPWWAMRTVHYYKDYNEALAKQPDHMIIYLVSEGPDIDRIYLNILQEAFVLYPADLSRIYLDVHVVCQRHQALANIPDFRYFDGNGKPANPDKAMERFGTLSIPVINVGGRWGNRDSLTRGLVMEYAMNEGVFDRERFLRSDTARKMAEGLAMEYRFDTVFQEGFAAYWASRGLDFEVHEYCGERWMTMVPSALKGAKDVMLPVLIALQEVYPGNEHLAVASMSYFYEAMNIAAQGECILLFFVLEDPKSNELVLDILEEAKKLYSIDSERVYLTGHSHDGGFARILAYDHPDIIAAVAVMGNAVGLLSSKESGNPVGGTEDDAIAALSKVRLPIINIGGEREHKTPAPTSPEFAQFARAWQRRLAICRCRQRSLEEIAAAQLSDNIVERRIGVPLDETQVLWLDGFEHYIGDLINEEGKRWTRLVCIDNSPHTVTPSMLTLCWSFLRRFARNAETGEVEERYHDGRNHDA